MTTKITYFNLLTSDFVGVFPPLLSSILIYTDSSYNVLKPTQTVSTTGGFIKITGSYFTTGTQVVIKNLGTKISTLTTNITYISSNELRVVMPSNTAGSKLMFVVSNDGSTAGTTITYA